MDPTSEVSRFEEKIRREEARVRGAAGARRLQPRRAVRERSRTSASMTEIEARLAALKSGRPQDSIGS